MERAVVLLGTMVHAGSGSPGADGRRSVCRLWRHLRRRMVQRAAGRTSNPAAALRTWNYIRSRWPAQHRATSGRPSASNFSQDNQAVAACITSGTCCCGNVMSLLRALFFVCAREITVRSLLLTFLVRLTQLPMLYPDRNGTDFVSLPLKLGSHPRRLPAFPVFRGRPLFSRARLCPASISASHQEGVHGWPGPFSQILLSTRSGAPASSRTNIGGVYRLFGRRGAMRTCHN